VQGDVDEQRLKDYQSRVTSWIGRQGLFFQIRYARLAGAGSIFTRIVSILIGSAIVGGVLLAMAFGVLTYYQSTEFYEERIQGQISDALGAESLEAQGFSRSSGQGSFQRLKVKGGEKSFFYEGKLLDLTGPFSLLAGVFQNWQPSSINLRKVELRLKAGGTSEEMETAMSGIVGSLKEGTLNRIEVENLNCEWGYSTLTHGGIYESTFVATWSDGEWRVSLKGGYFRQNWLGPMALQEAKLTVDETGVVIDSLVLTDGTGTIDLSGEIRGPLSLPQVDLTGRFSGLPVQSMFSIQGVPESRFIEGPVSGTLKITGSTNRKIETTGRVELGEGDELRIRDEWRLLKAISAVTRDGTYARIGFSEGGFDFSAGEGLLQVSGIDLISPEFARLKGEFTTRLFDQEEAAAFLEISLTNGFSNALTDKSSAQLLEDERISLPNAAEETGENFAVTLDLGGEDGELEKNEADIEDYDGFRLKQEMAKPRFDGQLQLGLPAKVLSGNEPVARNYPVGEEGLRWIPILLDSQVFSKISENEGEKLLEQGKAYRPGAGTTRDEPGSE
jgi:hypothetical protein